MLPAKIIIVHDDQVLSAALRDRREAAGHQVTHYSNTDEAWGILKQARFKLLITRVAFPAGMPHGVALAAMALTRQSASRVVFVGSPENQHYVNELGDFFPLTMPVSEIVEAINRFLED